MLCLVVAGAMAYDYGNVTQFNYEITEAMGTQTDYQILFTLSNATGVSGNNIIYTDGTTRPDWTDILPTDESDNPVPFWIENHTATSTSIKAWVKVPVISSDNTSVGKWYYGNASQDTTTMNIYNTFSFGDDFLGSAFNTSQVFVAVGSAVVSNGNASTNTTAAVQSDQVFGYNYTTRIRWMVQDEGGDGRYRVGFYNNSVMTYTAVDSYLTEGRKYMTQSGGTTWTSADPNSHTSFSVGEVQRFGGGNPYVNFTFNDGAPIKNTDYTPSNNIPLGFISSVSGTHVVTVDWAVVHKMVATPPTTTKYLTGAPGELIAAFSCTPTTYVNYPDAGIACTDESINSPTSWYWEFGDGSWADTQVSYHGYSSEGVYSVNLTVTNDDGSSYEYKSNYITVLAPPIVADFGLLSPIAVDTPSIVEDTSTGSPVTWNWTFGDGNTSTEQYPVNYFPAKGLYQVTLNVTNASGGFSEITKSQIVLNSIGGEGEPVADFDYVIDPSNSLNVSFTDLSENTPTGWAWFFGDENYNETWIVQNESFGIDAPWSYHLSVGAVLPNGHVIVTGGGDFGTATSVSSDKGITWNITSANGGWAGRQLHNTVAMPDNVAVLYGGDTGAPADAWITFDEGITWHEFSPPPGWTARVDLTSVVGGSTIVMFGGWTPGTEYNDVWQSSDYGNTWTLVNSSFTLDGEHAAAAVITSDYRILSAGGFNDTVYKPYILESDDGGVTWTETTRTAQWASRNGLVYQPDGNLVVPGGYEHNTVIRSTDEGATWETLSGISPCNPDYISGCSALPLNDGSIITYGNNNSVSRLAPQGSNDQHPYHTYTTPGTYLVSLQSYNDYGKDVYRAYVTVSPPATPTPTPAPTSNISQNTNTLWSPHQVVFQCLDGNNNPIINTPISALASYTTLPGGMANAVAMVQSAFGMPADSASQLINSTTAMSGVTDRTGSAVFVMLPVIAYDITFKDATGINYTTAAPIMPQDAYYQLNTPNATHPSQANLELAYIAKMNASVFNTTYSQTANATLGTLGMYIYDSTGQTTGANCWWTLMDNSTTWWSNRTWAPGSGLQTFGKTVITTPFQQWKWGCSTL